METSKPKQNLTDKLNKALLIATGVVTILATEACGPTYEVSGTNNTVIINNYNVPGPQVRHFRPGNRFIFRGTPWHLQGYHPGNQMMFFYRKGPTGEMINFSMSYSSFQQQYAPYGSWMGRHVPGRK